ncbi:LOW QUALITY PROTEIN: uncharacterized protein GJ701_011878 [Geothlypis trichas]
MMGCKSNSLTCLQGGKPGLPLATATDSTATLNKLALATGGTEKSWYRCIFPFGIVSVVIGVAATCITFTINGPQMDIAKVVSVATLIFGVGLLVAAYVCWRAKRERQRQRQRQEPVALERERYDPGWGHRLSSTRSPLLTHPPSASRGVTAPALSHPRRSGPCPRSACRHSPPRPRQRSAIPAPGAG